MKLAARLALTFALGVLALNLIAFANLEKRSKALDKLQIELVRALEVARDSSIIQHGEPPRGLLVFAIFRDDYGVGINDLCGAVGRWNGRSLIHTYIEGGKAISYAVANKAPRAWYPIPDDL